MTPHRALLPLLLAAAAALTACDRMGSAPKPSTDAAAPAPAPAMPPASAASQ